jgi:hypothetical protein
LGKGKKTPENLARETISDFFNSIDPQRSFAVLQTGRSRCGSASLRILRRQRCSKEVGRTLLADQTCPRSSKVTDCSTLPEC